MNTHPTTSHQLDTIDCFATWNTTKVTSRQLRQGMLLVDPEGFGVYILTERYGNAPGGRGGVEWSVVDIDSHKATTVTLETSLTPTIRVATTIATASQVA